MSFYPTYLPWSYPPLLYSLPAQFISGGPRRPSLFEAGSGLASAFHPANVVAHQPLPHAAQPRAGAPHFHLSSPTLTSTSPLTLRPPLDSHPSLEFQEGEASILEKIRQLQETISAHQAKLETVIAALQDRLTRLEHKAKQSEEDSLARGHQTLQAVLADLASQGMTLEARVTPPTGTSVALEQDTLPIDNQPRCRNSTETIDPRVLRFERFDTPFETGSVSSIPDTPDQSIEEVEVENDSHEPTQASQTLQACNDPEVLQQSCSSDSGPATSKSPPTPLTSTSSRVSGTPAAPTCPMDCKTSHQTGSINEGAVTPPSPQAAPHHSPSDEIKQQPGVIVRQLRPRNKTAPARPIDSPPPPTTGGRAKLKKVERSAKRRRTASKTLATGPKRKSTGPVVHLPIGVLATSTGEVRVQGAIWPKSKSNSIRGLGQDIQCDACGGRAHWTCAGFADHEVYRDSEWTCPDCVHLRRLGRPSMPYCYDGTCIRPTCVRRHHKKYEAQPGDADLYVMEAAIGRKLVSPATEDAIAKYEYLVKWWGYSTQESTWEPETSFNSLSEVSSQFIAAMMEEGVSQQQMKGTMILLGQAREAFDEQGALKEA